MSGIYQIRNLINSKIYIGSSVCIEKRWKWHKSRLRNSTHSNIHLQRSWDKYGSENFVFEILESVTILTTENKKEFKIRLVNDREQYYLDSILFAQEFIRRENKLFEKLGYNINPSAHSTLGTNVSDETKLKISESLIGKLSGDKNPNFGNIMCTESRKKISDFRKEHGGRQIICLDSGIKYKSIKEAAFLLNIKEPNIRHVLKGRWKHTHNLSFVYLT